MDADFEGPELLSKVLANLHFHKNTRVENFPALERYLTNESKRSGSIQSVLKGGKMGEFTAKFLNASCVLCGAERSADIFARFMFFAKNREELKNFLSFAVTVTPFFPNIMTLAIQHLMQSIDKYMSELSDTIELTVDAHNSYFITNLLTIIEWQNRAGKDDSLKYLGINLADLGGSFLENLLSWGLIFVEEIGRQRNLNEVNASVIDSFLNLMRVSLPRVQLCLRHPNRLLVQFCSLIVALLKLVNKENFGTVYDGVDFVCRCYAVTGVFFTYQNSASLFGTPKNESRISSDSINFDTLLYGRLLSIHLKDDDVSTSSPTKEEYSCLRDLRSAPSGLRNAAAMAHSGVFSKRHCKATLLKAGESETLRILLFVNMIDNLCISGDGVNYDLETCKFLGEALVNRFCSDGITAVFSWLDWKLEREFISKYIEIAKSIEQIPFVYHFLLILTEVGLSGVFYALSIIKAQFAAILIQLESTPLKDSKIVSNSVLKIAQLFSIFIAANFIPNLLQIVFEIICRITNHEAYVILFHFWALIRSLVPENIQQVASINENVLKNPNLLTTGAGDDFVSMVVLVVQRNIDKLGVFLPQIIEEAGVNVNNDVADNEWD